MNKPLTSNPDLQKLSGPITYTVDVGFNVFPWLSDRGFVRVLDGELVIFQSFKPDRKVAVSIGGRDVLMSRSEWRALPVYKGQGS
jgi:hypothetical protein